MDSMEFEEDYIIVYLLITFAVFPLKETYELRKQFSTSTKENNDLFSLKSQRERKKKNREIRVIDCFSVRTH